MKQPRSHHVEDLERQPAVREEGGYPTRGFTYLQVAALVSRLIQSVGPRNKVVIASPAYHLLLSVLIACPALSCEARWGLIYPLQRL